MTKAEGSKAVSSLLLSIIKIILHLLRQFQFNEYKAELFKEAERIVMEEFPKKVIEYDNMLKVVLLGIPLRIHTLAIAT